MSQAGLVSPWLTIEQLAERWHTTVNALYLRRRRGDMPPASRPGKSRALLWHIEDVVEAEQEARAKASA